MRGLQAAEMARQPCWNSKRLSIFLITIFAIKLFIAWHLSLSSSDKTTQEVREFGDKKPLPPFPKACASLILTAPSKNYRSVHDTAGSSTAKRLRDAILPRLA
jgi:hypothetical protein